ncbi:MAG: radical SAM protein [Myxococcota bacterium]|jgi:MoaA/NifB/PqqE/SkfB family radical SAM enzyme
MAQALPRLDKVIIEPTTRCNLQCTTCMRNTWDEPYGDMTAETFSALMRGLRELRPSKVAFWGIGEPLMNPRLVEMVRQAKSIGARVGLITNGILLNREIATGLVLAGLDTLIVSQDGTSHESHESVRPGIDGREVHDNIAGLRRIRDGLGRTTPEIGIEFVAMKQNLSHLRELPALAESLGAKFVVVTNVLPYSEDLKNEILYWIEAGLPHTPVKKTTLSGVYLPPMDRTRENLVYLDVPGATRWSFTDQNAPRSGPLGYCPFVNEGALAVSWDGSLSPCVPLMHTYKCWVMGREKLVKSYIIGDVNTDDVKTVWEGAEHAAFQRRVLDFGFSPCVDCGGCEKAESNQEDCFGNNHPTCGDCLWASGIIVCP